MLTARLFVATGSDGRIAQLVEQLTLNQRVLGSSPSASTMFLNDLPAKSTDTLGRKRRYLIAT